MPAQWRLAIPLAVVVAVLVGASVWMFARDDAAPAARPGAGGPPSSTIPGQGKDTGLEGPVTGDLVLYGVPSSQGALKGLKQGFEASNPDATITIVTGPVLDLVARVVEDPAPGAVIAPQRAVDAVKGVSAAVGTPAELGRNLFVIAVPKGNPKQIDGLEAFEAEAGLRVRSCGPDSPYGNFGQLVLDEAGIEVADGVVGSGCARDAMDQLEAGALDAALVLRSAKRRTVQTVPIPEPVNIVIPISIAQVGEGDASASLLTYATSEAGRSILTDRGFLP